MSFLDMDADVRVFLMVLREIDTDCMQSTLDIIVQRTEGQKQSSVLIVWKNFYYDAFFSNAIGERRM